jgi:hypothetical protein
MSLFIFTSLYFFQFAGFVAGGFLILTLGLGLLLLRALNQILSVTEEYEVPENIDSDSFINFSFPGSFSGTDGSEGSLQTASSFRSN